MNSDDLGARKLCMEERGVLAAALVIHSVWHLSLSQGHLATCHIRVSLLYKEVERARPLVESCSTTVALVTSANALCASWWWCRSADRRMNQAPGSAFAKSTDQSQKPA